MPKLVPFVIVIVGQRSNPEMDWIHTLWVIAAMQNTSAFWNRTVDAFVGHSMSTQLSPVVVGNQSVAGMVNGPGPRPAIVGIERLVEVEESNREWSAASAVTASLGAIRMAWTTWRTKETLLTQQNVHESDLITNGAC